MTSLAVESLLDSVLVPEKTVRHVNFFNGRLLTASDLQAQQLADRLGRQQLGRMIGPGVASGFAVELVADGSDATSPVVSVTGGLALDGTGQPIELRQQEVEITLARSKAAISPDIGVFDDCDQPPPGSDISGKGSYLLVIRSASAYREQAPMVRVGGNGVAAGCGDAYVVEGVTFRLVEIPLSAFAALPDEDREQITTVATEAELASLPLATRRARLSLLRNLLASACLRGPEDEAFARDPDVGSIPRGTPGGGLLGAVRDACVLDASDVPIALVHWTNRGVRFLDMWSVRRRPALDSGLVAGDDRRQAEGEARMLQFEDQVASLVAMPVSQATLGLIEARAYFRYLPPIAFVPLSVGASERGFAYDAFLSGVVHRDREFVEGSGLRALVAESLAWRRFDLTLGEALWTYEVRENVEAIVDAVMPRPQRLLVLGSAQMQHAAEARFDVGRWDYANYVDG
jgi:hypothetical protein